MSSANVIDLLNSNSYKVAIVGSGQLARMMALAGISMGYNFAFLCTEQDDTSAVQGLGHLVQTDYGKLSANEIYLLLGKPNVITVEKEDLDVELLRALNELCPVYPNPDAVEISQNRRSEKKFIESLGFIVAPWAATDHVESLMNAGIKLGWPLIIKRCSTGYDGKGQWRVKNLQEACEVLEQANPKDTFIAEQMIDFDKEVSIVSARDQHGNIMHYSLTENVHKDGILHYSFAPAKDVSDEVIEQAKKVASAALEKLDYVGVLTIEFFLKDDQLLINEFAPRVHNSGHWTQIGCNSSQFHKHIRAISGQAIAQAPNQGYSAMINLLGKTPLDKHLLDDELQIHWYNKSVKPGRKVGHININDMDVAKVEAKLHQTLLDINNPQSSLSQTGS